MDDKLFDIFSEETEVPECVLRRVDETLEMIENSAESDRGYQKEEKTGKVINGTDRMGKIGTRKNWKRSLILDSCGSDGIWCHCFCSREIYGHFQLLSGSRK